MRWSRIQEQTNIAKLFDSTRGRCLVTIPHSLPHCSWVLPSIRCHSRFPDAQITNENSIEEYEQESDTLMMETLWPIFSLLISIDVGTDEWYLNNKQSTIEPWPLPLTSPRTRPGWRYLSSFEPSSRLRAGLHPVVDNRSHLIGTSGANKGQRLKV